jgi:hypothetical protein
VRTHIRDSPMVTVYCSITSERIVGPCFYHESATSIADYLDVLQNFCVPADITVAEVDDLISQREGAAAHYGATVRTALDGRFPGR